MSNEIHRHIKYDDIENYMGISEISGYKQKFRDYFRNCLDTCVDCQERLYTYIFLNSLTGTEAPPREEDESLEYEESPWEEEIEYMVVYIVIFPCIRKGKKDDGHTITVDHKELNEGKLERELTPDSKGRFRFKPNKEFLDKPISRLEFVYINKETEGKAEEHTVSFRPDPVNDDEYISEKFEILYERDIQINKIFFTLRRK